MSGFWSQVHWTGLTEPRLVPVDGVVVHLVTTQVLSLRQSRISGQRRLDGYRLLTCEAFCQRCARVCGASAPACPQHPSRLSPR